MQRFEPWLGYAFVVIVFIVAFAVPIVGDVRDSGARYPVLAACALCAILFAGYVAV